MRVPLRLRSGALAVATRGIGLLLLLHGGCGMPPVPVAKTSERYDFEAGRVALQAKRWLDAQTYLKRFLNQHPGHALADSAQFLLGSAQVGAKSFAEAAVEFALLVREFPRSELRDDAAFSECRCYFEQKSDHQLDPTFAMRARSCLNEFMLRYPDSSHRQDATELLQDIADLLAHKELELAEMWASRKLYRAALVYADEVLREYPASSWVPQALLLRGRCLQQMGDAAGAADAWKRLIDHFPEHPAASHARGALQHLTRDPAGSAARDSSEVP